MIDYSTSAHVLSVIVVSSYKESLNAFHILVDFQEMHMLSRYKFFNI